MLFGQSVFQSVLTRLKEESSEEEDAEGAGESFRVKGLGLGFVAPTTDEPLSFANSSEAYLDILMDAPPPEPEPSLPEVEEPPPIPAHLLRLSQDEIAEELAISDRDTEQSLAEKRRRFAKANHPDTVPQDFRENADIRMKTANLLIDNAIKGLFWR